MSITNEPTEAQVEAAAEAIHNLMHGDPSFKDSGRKWEMRLYARAALKAAQGAAPQADALPSSGVDEDALAEALMRHEFNALGQCMCGYATPDYGSGNRLRIEEKRHFTRALCEAAKRGELT